MPLLADLNLLVTNESDCHFFKFWFHDRVCDGISHQGELFYQFHHFSVQQRDQAYELGSKLIDRGVAVMICCSNQRYLLGVNLQNNWSVTPEGIALLRDEYEQQLLIRV